MNLTEEQIRAILACSGFELVRVEHRWPDLFHPDDCACDACKRQRGEGER